MKNYIIGFSLFFLIACQEDRTASAEDIVVDVEADIKSVVEGETYAYMEKDYQKWASYWDHGSDVLRLDIADGVFAQASGWEKNGGKLESFFKEHPEPITSTFENSNYLIFHDDNLSWVAFDQTWTSEEGVVSVAKATITLIKKEGDWKIISYTAIQYDAEGDDVDTLGRE